MKLLLIFLALVVFFVVSLSLWNAIQRKKGLAASTDAHTDGEACCGQHAFCEKRDLLNAVSEGKAEYFDDEELDVYAGTHPDQYTEEAVEQFREVLHSMLDADKPDWLRSLRQRGIALPAMLKAEMLQTMDALRSAQQKGDGTI
ncbi:MAG: phospholipase [Prevotella sp.]|jgi:hypothetical protein|nr:phospholipase [Prevotella sp.]